MFGFYALLAATGLAGGLMAGLLGIGGGIFFLLVLPDALHYLGASEGDIPTMVVANSLVATLISALAAGYQHVRHKTPGRGDILWIGVPAAVTAFLTLHFIVNQPSFSEAVFNQVVVFLLAALLARSIYSYIQETRRGPAVRAKGLKIGAGAGAAEMALPVPGKYFLEGEPVPFGKLAITGGISGLISSLTGLGGGVFAVPVLREWLHFPIRRASFVSSGTIVLSSLAALAFSLTSGPAHPLPGAAGFIVPRICFPIGAGVVVAAPIGVRLARKMSPATLSLLYIGFVAVVLVRRALSAW